MCHTNIVSLNNIIQLPTKLWLIFEYIEYDLRKYQEKHTPIGRSNIKLILYQILSGIQYCHSHRIIHRDIKPQNILLDKVFHVKICDFGMARAINLPVGNLTNEVVTLWYRPPELLLGQEIYSYPVDIWSIGCIFGEMLFGHPLFTGINEIHQLFEIFKIQGTPNEKTWPGVMKIKDFKDTFPKFKPAHWGDIIPGIGGFELDLLNKLLCLDPASRITANQALLHVIYIYIYILCNSYI